jgi:protoheme IX farnesyltransferase
MLWYNGIYTNLKRMTPHAVIPGSVIGSIPPLVGWVSAGGDLFTVQALIMAVFFFVWQVPHFYLLAVKFGHEYEAAGLPSILHRWSESKIKKHIFFWILFTAAAATVLAVSNLPASSISSVLIIIASLLLVIAFRNFGFNSNQPYNPFPYFMRINYYVLAITVFLIGGPLLYYIFHI